MIASFIPEWVFSYGSLLILNVIMLLQDVLNRLSLFTLLRVIARGEQYIIYLCNKYIIGYPVNLSHITPISPCTLTVARRIIRSDILLRCGLHFLPKALRIK